MGKISWPNCVRNEEVLQRAKEERKFLQTIKERNAKWIFQILRRNCLLKHVPEGKTEGRIEVTVREGKRSNQLLDDMKEIGKY